MALEVGITERALISILADLHEYGCISVKKSGRKNVYKIIGSLKLRHPIEAQLSLMQLLELFARND